MAGTTPLQHRTISKTTRVIAALVLVAAGAVLVIRLAVDRSVASMVPAALLVCVAAGGLLAAGEGARKKADEIERQ